MIKTASYTSILLLGAPGAGKGTQGESLGNLPGFFHCASGDIFRALNKDSVLGQKVLAYSSKGNLVPDEITVEIVRTQLRSWVQEKKYLPESDILILDGIPRTVNQVSLLSDFIQIERVVHLSCPEREVLVKRMQQRALAKGRVDDANEAIIRNRFSVYEEETKPILEFFGDSRVTTINALEHPIEVLYSITKSLVDHKLFHSHAMS